MFLDISRLPPTFRSSRLLNRFCYNRASVPHLTGELLNVLFLTWMNGVNVPHLAATFLNRLFLNGIGVTQSLLTFWICYFLRLILLD
jgi:hypothetical protein